MNLRRYRTSRGLVLLGCCAAALAGEAAIAPAALASPPGGIVPAGFLGLPSLHGIVEAIANGFFSALAKALVPSWLTHATVATIQHLVALPDPAEWTHVSSLQGEMTYLGAMLAPVTLSVAAMRYWSVGLTGAAHPASAIARCVGATGVLVAYRWIVEEVVAATNTLTHGLLGLPTVSAGLGRIIGVLFGGALLTGVGGVFGALLVIVGVVLAAGLFAVQVLLTVLLAVLIVAGPPLIALAAIPELAHLARAWRDLLMMVALIPLAWTVLFAAAGALCLDATSFTGGASGLPGHVAAAFAGLITFALAVKLPLVLLGQVRHALAGGRLSAPSAGTSAPAMPGAERVRHAHARLRAVGLAGAPALGASVGAAAGALGAPAGGPLGAARRRLSRKPDVRGPGSPRARSGQEGTGERTVGERALRARAILARAPLEARRAVTDALQPSVESGRSRRPVRSAARGHDSTRGGGDRAGAAPPAAPRPHGTPARPSASTSRPTARVTLAPVPRVVRQPVNTPGEVEDAATSTPPRPPIMHAVGEPPRTSAQRSPEREPSAYGPAAGKGTPRVARTGRQQPTVTPVEHADRSAQGKPPRKRSVTRSAKRRHK